MTPRLLPARIRVLLVLSAAALMFAACGSTGDDADAPPAPDTRADAQETVDTADVPPPSDAREAEVAAPEKVRIVRDTWGVPHILATTDRGAAWGFGYAMADDHLVNALSAYYTVIGRRSEIEGESALGIDRTMRMFRLLSDVEADWDAQSPEVRDYLEGFAAGFNAYMREHPEEVPAWAEPVQPSWVAANGRFIVLISSIFRANNQSAGLCPDFAEIDDGLSDTHYIGSNGWALAPSRTAEGQALFLGDPHLPFKYEFRFYEAHLRGATFEVAGASLMGGPLPVLGRTAHVAWTWTSNSPDHADAYRLTLDPADPARYLLDGQSTPFEEQTLTFRLPDGSVRTDTLLTSVHGPVGCVNAAEGYALAYRLTGFGQTRAPEQMLAMYRARDLDEFEAAMHLLQFPHFDLVAADDSGHIVFVNNGRIPRHAPGLDYGAPLDGSTSATLWPLDDPVPYAELPRVRDPQGGFVQNCNNSPDLTTGEPTDPQPADWPAGIHGESEDTERAFYLRKQLAQRPTFTEADGLALATDGTIIPFDPLAGLLQKAWADQGAAHPHASELASTMELFEGWDGSPKLSSAAPTLFLAWLYKLTGETMIPPEMMAWTAAQVDAALATKMLDALWEARQLLMDAAGVPGAPWALVHKIVKNGKTYPVATGQYPAISLMNCNLDPTSGDLATASCTVGSAYTHFAVMGQPIRSYSVTPLGQTDRTDKPYAALATELFAKRQLKPLPFTDAEIEAHRASELVLDVTP